MQSLAQADVIFIHHLITNVSHRKPAFIHSGNVLYLAFLIH